MLKARASGNRRKHFRDVAQYRAHSRAQPAGEHKNIERFQARSAVQLLSPHTLRDRSRAAGIDYIGSPVSSTIFRRNLCRVICFDMLAVCPYLWVTMNALESDAPVTLLPSLQQIRSAPISNSPSSRHIQSLSREMDADASDLHRTTNGAIPLRPSLGRGPAPVTTSAASGPRMSKYRA